MCMFCAPRQSIDTCPIATSAQANQSFSEGADAADNTTTTYSMGVGDSFDGTLTTGDRDWVEISLTAGGTYEIALTGLTLNDPYLRLHDASGAQIAFDDDGAGDLDSLLSFTASSTGSYYISAGAYNDGGAGTYSITVAQGTPPSPAAVGTITEMATYLTDGYWGGSGYQFDTSSSNQITVNLTGLNADGTQLARWALDAWELVADLEFVEVSSGGIISFDDDQSGAFAGTNSIINGYAQSAYVNVSTAWVDSYGVELNSYAFQTYIHEIGHALGLGHQGGYNGNATYGTDEDFLNDSWQMSVMSYFSQTENTSINASLALSIMPMMVDVVAIQDLYGVSDVTAGDTNWGTGTFGTYLDDVFDAAAGGTGGNNFDSNYDVAVTIFDQGGVDTIDLSFTTTTSNLNMNAERFSDVFGLIGNLGIATGTVIENAALGSAADTVTGNEAANSIEGNGGDDLLSGLDGNDSLLGAVGNDTLNGQGGADDLIGGAGDDSVSGGSGYDDLIGGAGLDTLNGGSGNDSLDGGADADLLHGVAGSDNIAGGDGDDSILGGNGFDTITGDDGNDSINSGLGLDTVYGGNGNDTILGNAGSDLLFGDAQDDHIEGQGGNDSVYGGSGADNLFGGYNNDTLDGGTGNDTLSGGLGADNFVFAGSFGNDIVLDFLVNVDDADFSGASGIGSFDDWIAASVQSGADVLTSFDSNTVTFESVQLTAFDAADFIF
ncbi:M10 family metallopeptidase C-terminal domain-containing protein [Sulfitobacter sp. HNIBRBA2951]|uniref:M10 family metallopeptidase C-terminal domain-containing protein n=1 Tax=Sulfitobacter aquimarinus TaxID=3158557 RepID=UPI0032DE8640